MFWCFIGLFGIISTIWGISNLHNNYYIEQYYNNLPSLSKPQHIQHYEDMRDKMSEIETDDDGNVSSLVNIGGFLQNLSPGLGAFIVIIAVFTGVGGIMSAIVNAIRFKMR